MSTALFFKIGVRVALLYNLAVYLVFSPNWGAALICTFLFTFIIMYLKLPAQLSKVCGC